MSAYIERLQHAVTADQAEGHQKKLAEAQAVRQRLTPLEDRLNRVLAGIPDEVQAEGLSLHAVQAQLKGRWRGNCHPGELGGALRKLGYRRRRQWRDSQGFRSLWFPE